MDSILSIYPYHVHIFFNHMLSLQTLLCVKAQHRDESAGTRGHTAMRWLPAARTNKPVGAGVAAHEGGGRATIHEGRTP